jgi:hypothetical protein
MANGVVKPCHVVFLRHVLYPYSDHKFMSGNQVRIFNYLMTRVRS